MARLSEQLALDYATMDSDALRIRQAEIVLANTKLVAQLRENGRAIKRIPMHSKNFLHARWLLRRLARLEARMKKLELEGKRLDLEYAGIVAILDARGEGDS